MAAYAKISSYYTKSRMQKADIQYAPHKIIRLWSAADARVRTILVCQMLLMEHAGKVGTQCSRTSQFGSCHTRDCRFEHYLQS